jgi:hypothetical protein
MERDAWPVVFSFLNADDVILKYSLVCKLFHYLISNSPHCYHSVVELNYEEWGISSSVVKRKCSLPLRNMKELTICNRRWIPYVSEYLPYVSVLTIVRTPYLGMKLDNLRKLSIEGHCPGDLPAMPKLQEFDISTDVFDLKQLTQCTELTKLDINMYGHFNYLGDMRSLWHLPITSIRTNHSNGEELSGFRHLQWLNTRFESDDALTYLRGKPLTYLSFSSVFLSRNDADVLLSLDKLVHLKISNCYINDDVSLNESKIEQFSMFCCKNIILLRFLPLHIRELIVYDTNGGSIDYTPVKDLRNLKKLSIDTEDPNIDLSFLLSMFLDNLRMIIQSPNVTFDCRSIMHMHLITLSLDAQCISDIDSICCDRLERLYINCEYVKENRLDCSFMKDSPLKHIRLIMPNTLVDIQALQKPSIGYLECHAKYVLYNRHEFVMLGLKLKIKELCDTTRSEGLYP